MTNTTDKTYARDKVIRIIGSVIDKVEKESHFPRDLISKELWELHQAIEETRSEISAMRPTDIGGKDIPSATDQLDAITESVGQATGGIMDNCEKISQVAEGLDDAQQNEILGYITNIYEHCTFHDLTTQRINKIISTLKNIDAKVNNLMEVMGTHHEAEDGGSTYSAEEQGDPLLNGPQLPDDAMSQEDIDRLLSEFDD